MSITTLNGWSKTDGTLKPDGTLAVCPIYTPLSNPWNWVPTPPQNFVAAGLCQGSLRTFIPAVATTVFPPPPPAYSTNPASEFYQATSEVYTSRNNITAD